MEAVLTAVGSVLFVLGVNLILSSANQPAQDISKPLFWVAWGLILAGSVCFATAIRSAYSKEKANREADKARELREVERAAQEKEQFEQKKKTWELR